MFSLGRFLIGAAACLFFHDFKAVGGGAAYTSFSQFPFVIGDAQMGVIYLVSSKLQIAGLFFYYLR